MQFNILFFFLVFLIALGIFFAIAIFGNVKLSDLISQLGERFEMTPIDLVGYNKDKTEIGCAPAGAGNEVHIYIADAQLRYEKPVEVIPLITFFEEGGSSTGTAINYCPAEASISLPQDKTPIKTVFVPALPSSVTPSKLITIVFMKMSACVKKYIGEDAPYICLNPHQSYPEMIRECSREYLGTYQVEGELCTLVSGTQCGTDVRCKYASLTR